MDSSVESAMAPMEDSMTGDDQDGANPEEFIAKGKFLFDLPFPFSLPFTFPAVSYLIHSLFFLDYIYILQGVGK